MSIVFGKDGTLQCNTIKYNWKQARNLIADGCYANRSKAFSLSGVSAVSNFGYKSYRSFKFATGTTAMMTQNMPTPIAGHKYYGALRWCTSGSSFSAADNRFEWYTADTATGHMVFANKGVATNGGWMLLSSIQSLASVSSGAWVLRNFLVNSTTDAWCTRMMIVDLTDTFGAGNEPTKEWCDANIREHETLVNTGSILTSITTSNSVYQADQGSFTFQNYLEWDYSYRPREYTITYTNDPSYSEGYLIKTSDVDSAIDANETYYASMETCYLDNYCMPIRYQCYWPIAEPAIGSVPCVDEKLFNGGGGMSGWKRASFFASRSSFGGISAPVRWDFDNNGYASAALTTGHQICKVSSNIDQYNRYNGTNITISDVNKEWCDRWIDNRGFSYVHIKDPNNTGISITPDSDIVCNDVEIRPEIDSIIFRPDGTIVCKKLVKDQEY